MNFPMFGNGDKCTDMNKFTRLLIFWYVLLVVSTNFLNLDVQQDILHTQLFCSAGQFPNVEMDN